MLRFLRNTTFVIWLTISLASFAVTATVWAVSQTLRVAALTKTVATQTFQNRKQIARLKAIARLRRIATAVPVLGLGTAAYFEETDIREWLEDNPGKTNADYACEIADLTAEVMDEVLAELPSPTALPEWAIPECRQEN